MNSAGIAVKAPSVVSHELSDLSPPASGLRPPTSGLASPVSGLRPPVSNLHPFPLDTIWAIEETRLGALINGLQNADLTQARVRLGNLSASLDFEVSDGVALIPIEGPLTKKPSIYSVLFGGSSTLLIQRAIEQALADDQIKAIVLKIDSPGGSVDGMAELGDVIFEGRKIKQIIAQVTGLAASAGYYIASQAKQIFAQRMDLVGSIGTRMLIYDWNRFFENAGVTAIAIHTGPLKSAGALGTDITKDQQAYFQSIVDDYFADFVKMVARGRRVSQSKVKEWADGRVYPATEAMVNGLVDGIQTLEVTLAGLKPGAKRQKSSPAVAAGRGGTMKGEKMNSIEESVEVMSPEQTGSGNERHSDATVVTPLIGQTAETAKAASASLAELKSALPGAESDFLLACLERGDSIDQAKSAYIKELQTARMADAGRIESLEAAARKPGVKPLGTENQIPGASSRTGVSDDPVTAFNDLVDEKIKAGMPKPAAIRAIVRAHPELHQAMVATYNEQHGRPGRIL